MESDGQIKKADMWKALVSGALGGLIASFAMSEFHALVQKAQTSEKQEGEDSTVKAASAISRGLFGHELTAQEKKIAGPVMHYAFGASMASIYGVVAEAAPAARAGWGLAFGAAVWLGAHVIMVPALGLSEPITESTPGKEASEFGAHLVYGAVTESVRRVIRARVLR